jgi:uncharacterized membrane protein YgcG
MARETLRNSELVQSLSDVLSDLSELVQKEIRLARTEVTEKISAKLQASVWMVAAGFLGVIVVLLLVETAVFAIASTGLGLTWASLIVAGIVALIAAAVFYHGRSLAEEELLPARSLRQVTRDIQTAKEQLT